MGLIKHTQRPQHGVVFQRKNAPLGVRSGDELCISCIFDQICKQKIIDILNNTKKLLNSMVSFSAKLIIND